MAVVYFGGSSRTKDGFPVVLLLKNANKGSDNAVRAWV